MAVDKGAHIINDISAGTFDKKCSKQLPNFKCLI